MNIQEAKSVVLDYLVGRRRVAPEELDQATWVAALDADYVQAMRLELGTHSASSDECERVAERLDELCEIGMERLSVREPELAQHFESCSGCRRQFWEIAEVWTAPVPTGESTSPIRRLARVLAVAIDKLGRLKDIGLGFPADELTPAYAAMAHDEVVPQLDTIRRWELPDEDAGLTIRLELRNDRSSGELFLNCDVHRESGATADLQTRIEVRGADATVLHASSLDSFQQHPFAIGAGDHTIKLSCRIAEAGLSWEIPVAISAGDD